MKSALRRRAFFLGASTSAVLMGCEPSDCQTLDPPIYSIVTDFSNPSGAPCVLTVANRDHSASADFACPTFSVGTCHGEPGPCTWLTCTGVPGAPQFACTVGFEPDGGAEMDIACTFADSDATWLRQTAGTGSVAYSVMCGGETVGDPGTATEGTYSCGR
jgi:hypothetical protein